MFKNIENKKISLFTGVTSILLVILSTILKVKATKSIGYYRIKKIEIVNILGFKPEFNSVVIFCFVILILSLFAFLFLDDTLIMYNLKKVTKPILSKIDNSKKEFVEHLKVEENKSHLKTLVLYTLLTFVGLGIIIGLFAYNNYLTRESLLRPLFGFEAFYLNYFKTFIILLLLSLSYKFFKFLKKH